MILRFLDWATLVYSPSLMAIACADRMLGATDTPAIRYATAWLARRERAKRLPIVGAFFRAWERV